MPKSHNAALAAIPPSGIRRISDLAAHQPGCISLALGEPDFPTPEPICAEAVEALRRGETHYPPNSGTPALRRAIADAMAREGAPFEPEEIVVTAGATEAISSTFRALLEPGDEVIIPTPSFTLYDAAVRMNGAVPVPLDTAATGFQIDAAALDACAGPATKAIIICSPGNPTGCALDASSLDAVAALAVSTGAYVVCDDVYARLVYEGPCERFAVRHAELRDRTVVVDSFSKPWAMTGWRLGWVAAPTPVAAQVAKAHQFTVSSVPAFLMPAAARALDVDPAPMLEVYRARRERVLAAIDAMGLKVPHPVGAFYAFPAISGLGCSAEEFCERAIAEAGVALVPGECFGTPGYVRLSYCVADEQLDEGLRRLADFVARLRRECA